jgi:signal transduction histidine kinase
MDGAPDPVVEELRAVRAELAALRAEVREAIRRSEPWTDERRGTFVEGLRAAAAEGESSGFFTVEQVCGEMTADIEAVERERPNSGG